MAVFYALLCLCTHHYLRVPDGVLWDSDQVLGLLPLWRLVVDVGDGDAKVHPAASVAPISGDDLLGDPRRLDKEEEGEEEEGRKEGDMEVTGEA